MIQVSVNKNGLAEVGSLQKEAIHTLQLRKYLSHNASDKNSLRQWD